MSSIGVDVAFRHHPCSPALTWWPTGECVYWWLRTLLFPRKELLARRGSANHIYLYSTACFALPRAGVPAHPPGTSHHQVSIAIMCKVVAMSFDALH